MNKIIKKFGQKIGHNFESGKVISQTQLRPCLRMRMKLEKVSNSIELNTKNPFKRVLNRYRYRLLREAYIWVSDALDDFVEMHSGDPDLLLMIYNNR